MTEGLVNGFASGFLSRLWLVTWQGTFVALAVWTICRSRSISSRTKCWLWWAVSLRMLIGILPLGGVPLPILPPEPQSTPRMLTIPSHRQPSLRPLYWQVDPVPTSVSTSSEASDGVASPGPSQSMPPAIWLLGMWIAGVLVFSLRIFAQGLAARKLIREATPVQDAPASDLFARLLTEARVRQSVALLEHPAVNGPLLVGVLRPRVLLPTDASTSFSPEELRLALSHEVIHIRRNDLLFSFVPYVARTLFFFHPLAWLAVREHRLALEAACDRDALVLTGGPVSDYGRLLLRLAATADQRTSAALGAASNYRVLERRLKMLQFPSPSSRTGTVTLAMAIVAVTGILIPWRLEAQRSRDAAAKAKQAQEADQAVVVTTAQSRPARTTKQAQPARAAGQGVRATTAVTASPSLTPALTVSTPTAVAATALPTAAVASTISAPVAAARSTGQRTSVASTLATPVVPASSLRPATVAQGVSAGTTIASSQNVAATALSVPQAANRALAGTVAQTLTTTPAAANVTASVAQALTVSGHNNRASAQSLSSVPVTGVGQLGGSLRSSRSVPHNLSGAGVTSVGQPTLAGSLSTRPVGAAADMRYGLSFAPQIHFKDVRLVAALKSLLSREGSDYVLALGDLANTEISADFKGISTDQAIDTLLNGEAIRSRLVSLNERDIRVISSTREDEKADRVTLRFYKRDATEALAALFAAAHVGCSLSGELQGQAVTTSLTNVPFKVALDTILRALPRRMTYQVESGVYRIETRE